MLLRGNVELLVAEYGERFHFLHDLTHVLDGMYHVTGAGFALGADHGSTFGDAAESLAQIACAADEWCLEGVLVDVMGLIGRSEHFGLVDEVDPQLLEDLRFGEVSDAGLRHDGNGNSGDDLADELRIGHAGHAAFGANHCGHTFQSHHRDCAGLFGNPCLLDVHHVHDDAALEHFGEADLQTETVFAVLCLVAVVGGSVLFHLRNPLLAGRRPLLPSFQFSS